MPFGGISVAQVETELASFSDVPTQEPRPQTQTEPRTHTEPRNGTEPRNETKNNRSGIEPHGLDTKRKKSHRVLVGNILSTSHQALYELTQGSTFEELEKYGYTPCIDMFSIDLFRKALREEQETKSINACQSVRSIPYMKFEWKENEELSGISGELELELLVEELFYDY